MIKKAMSKDLFLTNCDQNWTVAMLCERFGICKSTAYNWLRKYSSVKRTKGRTITANEHYRLERENRTLLTENEIFRRSSCSISSPLAEKLAAIDRLKSDFTVHILCQTLGVLKSTYYHHALRSPAKKQCELADDELRPIINQIFVDSRERFGAQKKICSPTPGADCKPKAYLPFDAGNGIGLQTTPTSLFFHHQPQI